MRVDGGELLQLFASMVGARLRMNPAFRGSKAKRIPEDWSCFLGMSLEWRVAPHLQPVSLDLSVT